MSPGLDRRTLLLLLSGWLSATALPEARAALGAGPVPLARAIGLRDDQEAWLDDLTPEEQRDLYEALANPGEHPVARTIELLAKVLGRRSRLFAFIDYPQVADVRSVCDGLLRE